MKKLLTLSTLLVLSCFLFAQNPSKVTIKGLVQDTFSIEQPFATVMLLNPKDSALINFTRGDEKGLFEFKNVKNTAYLLKISFVGFIPFQQNIEPSASTVNDLGALKMKTITKELMEVVIKTAKAPLSIKGDTIEYNASSFKVPPGSTVEDLLRRLPGIEVDGDGNIKAQGKDVKRLYVDGKSFFGDDPKGATKNLGAETISKVQVFTEKSEQAKLTGVDDGKKEKAMNLELKEEFKKGAFGKLTGAVGNEDRWATRGNYNRFNKKEQFSILGFANNINQTGVNWEDYGEFKGQNTFNNNDNGDFGFNGGGGRYYYFGSNDIAYFNNFDGRGFTKNLGSGVNYNFDNKKTKFSSNYFYNQTRLNVDQNAYRQTFLQDSSFFNTDTTNTLDFKRNHSIAGRLEHEFDSTNTLITKVNLRFTNSTTNDVRKQLFTGANTKPKNSLDINNDKDVNAFRLTSAAIFRHRFKTKGRSVAASFGYNDNRSDGLENLLTLTKFFQTTTFSDQVRQMNNNNSDTRQTKSSVLYTTPFSKKVFWEAFYNYSATNNEVLRQVSNPEKNNERIDNLSVFYNNDVLYNRVGSSIRYSYNGINVMAGLAGQQLTLKGQYALERNASLAATPINRSFNNFIPKIDMSIETKQNFYVNAEYSRSIQEPQFNDLQPVQNVSNPAFVIVGNPNLTPEKSNNYNLSLNYFNPASFANMNLWSEYQAFDSRIVYSQTIENIEKIGIRTTTKPENINEGYNFSTGLWLSFPIIKTKLTLNGNGNLNIGSTPSFVNGVRNETKSTGGNYGFGLTYTPDPKLILSLRASGNPSYIDYSIQKNLNQNIINRNLDLNIKWNFATKFFLESNYSYKSYKNDRFGFDRTLPIFNASIRRLFLKENKLEMRLAAFDILNKNIYINQFGSQNFVSRTEAPTLARYFMLSMTYNMRGFENKLNKNNWW
jgi:outer membrane receptor protein involved in Fe transport